MDIKKSSTEGLTSRKEYQKVFYRNKIFRRLFKIRGRLKEQDNSRKIIITRNKFFKRTSKNVGLRGFSKKISKQNIV